MPDEIFGKNEAEIEQAVHEKLQEIAKEATFAATRWADGWRNDRKSVTTKVMKSLDDKLEETVLKGLGLTKTRHGVQQSSTGWPEITAKVEKMVKDFADKVLSEDYLIKHPQYAKIQAECEAIFWRQFGYKMQDVARRAGERAAEATSSQYEKSMNTLIKRAVLDHFAASDGLAELAEEENRKNG